MKIQDKHICDIFSHIESILMSISSRWRSSNCHSNGEVCQQQNPVDQDKHLSSYTDLAGSKAMMTDELCACCQCKGQACICRSWAIASLHHKSSLLIACMISKSGSSENQCITMRYFILYNTLQYCSILYSIVLIVYNKIFC